MNRLNKVMSVWRRDNVPALIGNDFNVIPEDIGCHKPSSWINDALFQPKPLARYRALFSLGYTDAFRSLHSGEGESRLKTSRALRLFAVCTIF